VVNATSDLAEWHGTRVFRELLRQARLRAGGILLYSATVCRDGGAVVFCGASNADETTAALAESRGHELVSVDRTWVVPHGGRFLAFGWPAVARIGWGTLVALRLDECAARLSWSRPQNALSTGEFVDEAQRSGARKKLELNQMELEVLVGCQLVEGVVIDAIVVTELSEGAPPCLSRASTDDVAPAIATQFLHPDPSYPMDWLTESAGDVESARRKVAD